MKLKFIINLKSTIILTVVIILFTPMLLGAQMSEPESPVLMSEPESPVLMSEPESSPSTYERPADVTLKNPLKSIGNGGGPEDIAKLIGLIVKSLMGLIGSIVLLFFVKGAFTWLTSQGNPEKVMQGTKTMAFAGIGALVVFLSYMLAQLIIDLVTGGI